MNINKTHYAWGVSFRSWILDLNKTNNISENEKDGRMIEGWDINFMNFINFMAMFTSWLTRVALY